jgi:hypothetical protein
VERYLEDWARWKSRGSRQGEYPSHSSGIYGAGNTDFDSMCQEMDLIHARAVDAAIEGLEKDEKRVLHNRYLGAQWRLLSGPEALERAYARLAVSLYDKGLPGAGG